MNGLQVLRSVLAGGASVLTLASPAAAKVFDIPGGDLGAALNSYMQQSGVEIVYLNDVVRGHKSRGARGDLTETAALTQILRGTGFTTMATSSSAIDIVPAPGAPAVVRVAQASKAPAAPPPQQTGLETVVVTAQKKTENIQTVPIAVTALSQQQLTERQIAGGPDLVKEVPNLTFSKTNFTGYNLEIRGIGTQAISVTTDPAVAVALNDTPFIRNHFFEQEFFDVQDVEVLRGPQGTLYGRNATAGVVNLKSALPTDSYEAMLSADIGNYSNRRLEGMLNIPIVSDKLDIRVAGEWTKRDGYSFNEETNSPIDGRDLWSGRMTIGFKPTEDLQAYLIWEHFSEDDDRLRSGKQLCKTDYGPGGTPTNGTVDIGGVIKTVGEGFGGNAGDYFGQGCVPASLYSPDSFEAPLGYTLPYILALEDVAKATAINPYASETQSHNLRVIDSGINPTYRAKNDTLEFNANYNITPALTFTSQTGYNNDFLFSAEDYNRFGAAPGLFKYQGDGVHAMFDGRRPDPSGLHICASLVGLASGSCPTTSGGTIPFGAPCDPSTTLGDCNIAGYFCDPQVGCSDRLILEDLSDERAWQLSQEFRVASNFSGPLNFSAGANYLHYETEENYYVFGNVLTLIDGGYVPGQYDSNSIAPLEIGYQYNDPTHVAPTSSGTQGYVDPNPITNLNNEGHNYFLSENPYVLNSYAAFGEANYSVTDELKLVGGLRWTDDQKHFLDIPSWLVAGGYGYPVARVEDQQWNQLTGRAVADWTPKLDFTDQTLIYASYAHGYKAGGANPPGAISFARADLGSASAVSPVHPLTFNPEFIDAYELGTKNTLLDGALTLNGDVFFYNYTGYQISEIVDRTAINNNYNATVRGAELEANWEPIPALKFSFSSGYENATADKGDSGVDLMDRTAGQPGWVVVKPFVNGTSNCIFPTSVAKYFNGGAPDFGASVISYCSYAYALNDDPLTQLPYIQNPTSCPGYPPGTCPNLPPGYIGYNPATAPNDGAGFSKDLSGHQLPNAPHFTTSLTAEYTMAVSDDWAATLHADFYWQSQSWARIFNDNPYDKIHGYSNVNLSLVLNSANGWQVMAYVKNLFDTTAITGDFLNSDDSGLTTNVFLTDPRLYGVRVTKQLDQGDGFWGSDYSGYDFFTGLFSDADGGKPPLWIELGGQLEDMSGLAQPFRPPFFSSTPPTDLAPMIDAEKPVRYDLGENAAISFSPDQSDWVFSAAIRYGRSGATRHHHYQSHHPTVPFTLSGQDVQFTNVRDEFGDAQNSSEESHLVIDFLAGKDVGLGMFGEQGSSVVSVGARFAQFTSKSDTSLHARPFYASGPFYTSPGAFSVHDFRFQQNTAVIHSKRNTRAAGPSVSWNASLPVTENDSDAEVAVDWGVNAAALFGRQRAQVRHQTQGYYIKGFITQPKYSHRYTNAPANRNRSRNVVIPNLGGFAGVSVKFSNAKVSFGYRADEFFGAMDNGWDTRKSGNLGFSGPYANISIGLGG